MQYSPLEFGNNPQIFIPIVSVFYHVVKYVTPCLVTLQEGYKLLNLESPTDAIAGYRSARIIFMESVTPVEFMSLMISPERYVFDMGMRTALEK